MNVSGLSSVNTAADMQTWLAANCKTPISPVMTGDDLAAILEKMLAVSGTGGGGGSTSGVPYSGATQNVDLGSFNLTTHDLTVNQNAIFFREVQFRGPSAGFNMTDRARDYEQWSFYAVNGFFGIWSSIHYDDIMTLTPNLGGLDLTFYRYGNTGKVLVGNNRSGSLGETNFINYPGTAQTVVGGFTFSTLSHAGLETALLNLHGTTFAATFAGAIIPGLVQHSSDPASVFLTLSGFNNEIVSRNAATEVFGDLVQSVTASGDNSVSTHLKVTINGTSYNLLANNA